MKVEAGSAIRVASEKFAAQTALSTSAGEQTYAELFAAANRFGSGLIAKGAKRGERVGVLAYNTAEVVQAWLGLEVHNLVRVVLHSHFDMAVHVTSLSDVTASVLVFDTRFTNAVEKHRAEMRTIQLFVAIGQDCPTWAVSYEEVLGAGNSESPCLDVDEGETCFLQMTTGTTGKPKPWIKTYRSWQAVIDHNLHHFDTFGPGIPQVGPDDVNLHIHPIQWASGFQTLLPYYLRGARTVLADDSMFDPQTVIDVILKEGVTGVLIPGPLMTPILDVVQGIGPLEHRLRRLVIFFGTPHMLERTTDLLGPIWCHGFGSTEQGAVTTRLLASEAVARPELIGSVGTGGSPFFEVAIMDSAGNRLPRGEVGEIVVRSAMSIGSYWGMEERTRDAFFPGDWFRPGDVGYQDADGYLYYADRAVDTINTPDGAVYPHLVETAILRHEAVANCGVVGVAEGTGHGERQLIVAAVLLKDGMDGSVEMEVAIIATAGEGLKLHERPNRIVFMEELPTVLGGAKVQRQALREQLSRA